MNILVGTGVRKHCYKKLLTYPPLSTEPDILDGNICL